jgi:dipeptidyl-peptidase II
MAAFTVATYLIPQTGYSSPNGNQFNFSAQNLISKLTNLTDATEIINATLTTIYLPSSALYPCISWDDTKSGNPILQKDSFNYLLYNYFPLSTNEIPNGTIFSPVNVQTETSPEVCKNMYNLTPPTQHYVEKKWKITREDLVAEKRILFAYDEMDPTTAVGIQPLHISLDRNANRYMITSLAAHCEESHASFPGDKPSVIHVSLPDLHLHHLKCAPWSWQFSRPC